MKVGDKIREKETGTIWVIGSIADLCNVELYTEDGLGSALECFNPNCEAINTNAYEFNYI